jgi:hypothetical protein
VIGFILAFAATCAVRPARCSCFPPPEPTTAAEAQAYVRRAEEAFVGRVIRIDEARPQLDRPAGEQEGWDDVAVTLVVTSRWQGMPVDTVVVHTSSQASMCGMDFHLSASYFVMASREFARPQSQTSRLGVWTCGQSRPAARATRLLALLGPPAPR